MRTPTPGLGPAGGKLWRSTVDVFDFTDEPHKVQILTQACRVADVIAGLDEAADEAPLTVMGSMRQQVISPFSPRQGRNGPCCGLVPSHADGHLILSRWS